MTFTLCLSALLKFLLGVVLVNCTPKVGQKKSNFWGVFV